MNALKQAILAIETSHKQGSVALGDGTSAPFVVPFSPGLVHARELQPRIDEAVANSPFERTDLGLIAVSAGPGSYTGVRIGVATAKALAWGLGVPTLAVSTLGVIARNVTQPGDFAVVLDARRDACYGALFRCAETEPGTTTVTRLTEDSLAAPDEYLGQLPAGTPLVGEGRLTLPGVDQFPLLAPEWDVPQSAHVHALAQAQWTAIRDNTTPEPPEFRDPHELVPTYLRASQAEEMADARKKGS
ncbi:MAG: tRNA (adenosine(37)-N6)-threonylcarbamoyltransferase complex dimerization subunit type 1 TsaB [Planctomycetota bacterium]